MERYRKKDVLQKVAILIEANEATAGGKADTDLEESVNQLIQCQDTAVQIGTYLEAMGEECAFLVGLLEDYCENIYQMSLSLNDANRRRKLVKKIRRQLAQVKSGIELTMPADRREVVFLPYKASMWDSLESAWKALDADANTDAYVIPIPYYDKNPDGSFGQEHYEGDLYPASVPITRYDAYKIEERRPDAIFIHNPYDNGNFVTSVHPFFYSKNLKQYTDELIYIPYFILDEIDSEDEKTVEVMKHFCMVPGVFNADKVIVQSENIKRFYIKALLKAGDSHSPEVKRYWENKILGLGSPKIDKVLHTKKEDLEIPEEWVKIIEKPDRTWKKIIFYNTSVGALLEHRERMIGKIENVLRIFKSVQDDVALLWRPHPLTESTLKSMHPTLLKKYERIVEVYKKENWGIYDDTADMDRAIVLSDAYYGDNSSVLHLYKLRRKPVFLQNPSIIDELADGRTHRTDPCLHFENLYDDGECFWFTEDRFNALFRMDKDTWEAEYIGRFPNEKDTGIRLYAEIIEHGNKLYFTPLYADEIGVYDKGNGAFSKISFAELEIGFIEGSGRSANFYSAHLIDDCMYFMPHERNAVLKYDLKNGEVQAIYSWGRAITERYELSAPRLAFQSIYANGCIFAPISGGNLLAVLDIKTETTEILEIGSKENTYFDVCLWKNRLILAPLQGKEIISLRLPDMQTEKLFLEESNPYQFFSIIQCHDRLYMFPYQYKEILEITVNEEGRMTCGPCKVWNDTQKMGYRHPTDSRYLSVAVYSGRLYAYDSFEKKLIRFTPKTGELRKEAVKICISAPHGRDVREALKKAYFKAFEEAPIVWEAGWRTLGSFLELMT